jgi:hypothetical protein
MPCCATQTGSGLFVVTVASAQWQAGRVALCSSSSSQHDRMALSGVITTDRTREVIYMYEAPRTREEMFHASSSGFVAVHRPCASRSLPGPLVCARMEAAALGALGVRDVAC